MKSLQALRASLRPAPALCRPRPHQAPPPCRGVWELPQSPAPVQPNPALHRPLCIPGDAPASARPALASPSPENKKGNRGTAGALHLPLVEESLKGNGKPELPRASPPRFVTQGQGRGRASTAPRRGGQCLPCPPRTFLAGLETPLRVPQLGPWLRSAPEPVRTNYLACLEPGRSRQGPEVSSVWAKVTQSHKSERSSGYP